MTARQHRCTGPRHKLGACRCPEMERVVPVRERAPIDGYRLVLSCPSCGRRMTHATTRTDRKGVAANAVAECDCGCQARLDVVLTVTRHPVPPSVPGPDLLPLGPWLEFFPDATQAMLAAGWSISTLQRRAANGITEAQADALAAIVNRHPTSIWPNTRKAVNA